ncbi:MAG: hypothetical protein QW228_00925 [Candidatus Aenigmatarchaeota archaeon]
MEKEIVKKIEEFRKKELGLNKLEFIGYLLSYIAIENLCLLEKELQKEFTPELNSVDALCDDLIENPIKMIKVFFALGKDYRALGKACQELIRRYNV